MAPSNQKLCWNCDALVDKDAIVCLFCGSDLSHQATEPEPVWRQPKEQPRPQEQVVEQAKDRSDGALVSMLFLLPGIVFFFFSLMLVFFAEGSSLTLRWDAHYWYFWLIASGPLLFFGYKLLP